MTLNDLCKALQYGTRVVVFNDDMIVASAMIGIGNWKLDFKKYLDCEVTDIEIVETHMTYVYVKERNGVYD